MLQRFLAVALAVLGGWCVHSGVAAREFQEPARFVAGAGLIPSPVPGPDTRAGAASVAGEVRASTFGLVAPRVARAGWKLRSSGLGLLGAALALGWASAFRSPRGDGRARPFPWLATLVLFPAGYALVRLAAGASASAPSAANARAAFALWGPAFGLALLLVLTPPRTARGPRS